MNTKRLSAALGAAVLVVLGSATSAFATFSTPPPYETPSVELQLNPTAVTGGESFTATATSNQDCASWDITFVGPTTDGPGTGSGMSAETTFSTTEVSDIETGTVTATCNYDDGALKASAPAQLSATADITVSPAGVLPPTDGGDGDGDGFGGLASTGGPHLWLAIGGALLTLVGAGAVVRSRRLA